MIRLVMIRKRAVGSIAMSFASVRSPPSATRRSPAANRGDNNKGDKKFYLKSDVVGALPRLPRLPSDLSPFRVSAQDREARGGGRRSGPQTNWTDPLTLTCRRMSHCTPPTPTRTSASRNSTSRQLKPKAEPGANHSSGDVDR